MCAQVVEGQPVAADVRYVGLANQRRAGADSFTKILFQFAARHAPLTVEAIAAVIRDSPAAPPPAATDAAVHAAPDVAVSVA
jgi:snurportin-1